MWPSRFPGAVLQLVGNCCSLRRALSSRHPERSAAYNRGAYLATALAHCGECHTARNIFGATRSGQRLSGTSDGPDDSSSRNITPDPGTGIGKWEKSDVVELLKTRYHAGAEQGEGCDAGDHPGRAQNI